MKRETALLASVFVVTGIAHFLRPEPYTKVIPRPLPYKRELVYISGAAELACAGLLFNPSTRRMGGLASAGLLTAVFPVHLQMAADILPNARASWWAKVLTVVRMPLQVPMIKIALRADQD